MITNPEDVVTILIQNASHFLDSAIDQLSVSKDATNLHLSSQPYNRTPTSDHRNSLIFVAASVELLLKAKLATIHWSQIFEDPGKAQIEKLESQNLISVKASDLCSRITRLTREKVDSKTAAELFNARNATVHFSPPQTNAVFTQVLAGINFSIRFLKEHLISVLSHTETAVAQSLLGKLVTASTTLRALTQNRLISLVGELDNFPGVVTFCAACHQLALGMPRHDTSKMYECRFCFAKFSKYHYAVIYESIFLNNGIPGTEENQSYTGECPQCHSESAVLNISVRNRPNITQLCVNCLTDLSDKAFTPCAYCAVQLATEELCRRCSDELYATEDERRI